MRGTFSNNKTSTKSLWTSRKPLKGSRVQSSSSSSSPSSSSSCSSSSSSSFKVQPTFWCISYCLAGQCSVYGASKK